MTKDQVATRIEALTAERDALAEKLERAVEALTLIERTYYMEGKSAQWRAAHMNGAARDAQDTFAAIKEGGA